mgnify:CR=1 FL=1
MSYELVKEFNRLLSSIDIGKLRSYQEKVLEDILRTIDEGHSFIVVSMPTGSGKTFIEMSLAYWSLRSNGRVLVIEPTRFLCDQMMKLWGKVFKDFRVGRDYEGKCLEFKDRDIVLATPYTATKCIREYCLENYFTTLIIDEVHHAYGNKRYIELLETINVDYVFGFTALLPSYRRYREIPLKWGKPVYLDYDFKKLSELGGFESPKAIADIYDVELKELEDKVYELLFRGQGIQGDERIIKFLELTLVRYGKEAFCESLKKAINRGRIGRVDNTFIELCNSVEPSHKTRTILDILSVYNVNELSPILIFTSRKATAYEIAKSIEKSKLVKGSVAVLTSDVDRSSRLEIIKRIKSGDVRVVIATRVGEEGVDIPEAGLLIMSDIAKNQLRFYQRLGRLIRLTSPKKIKYLVITPTVKSMEYYDLEEAIWNLYAEGIDVSYLVINIEEKGIASKILEIVNKFSEIYNKITVPYTLITQGRELVNPIDIMKKKIIEYKELRELASSITQEIPVVKICTWDYGARECIEIEPMIDYTIIEGEEELAEKSLLIALISFAKTDKLKKLLDKLESYIAIDKGKLSKQLIKGIESRKVFYIYNVEKTSDIIAQIIKQQYNACLKEWKPLCLDNKFIKISRKKLLRLLMDLFIYDKKSQVIEQLRKDIEKYKRELMTFDDIKIYVGIRQFGDYNVRGKSVVIIPRISITVGNNHIGLSPQISYYDIPSEDFLSEVKDLIKLNVLAIAYGSVSKFINMLEH